MIVVKMPIWLYGDEINVQINPWYVSIIKYPTWRVWIPSEGAAPHLNDLNFGPPFRPLMAPASDHYNHYIMIIFPLGISPRARENSPTDICIRTEATCKLSLI